MKLKDMDRLIAHFDRYFEQTDCMILHPAVENEYHIDVLLYKPNKRYPFWKLVTMGAGDYKMPAADNTISRYNEYIMFVSESEDLDDKEILRWYHDKLMVVATFAYIEKTHVTYGHSFEWENDDPEDEMIAAFIGFPQIIGDVGVLRCKLSMFKTVACLEMVLLNRAELDRLLDVGPESFDSFLYPEGDGAAHFLCEKHRSEKF